MDPCVYTACTKTPSTGVQRHRRVTRLAQAGEMGNPRGRCRCRPQRARAQSAADRPGGLQYTEASPLQESRQLAWSRAPALRELRFVVESS
jgi:hypothetical protein